MTIAKTLKLGLLVSAAAALGACAAPTETTLADGTTALLIDCFVSH